MIVGQNPGTDAGMHGYFWEVWNSTTGCNRLLWLKKYEEVHAGRLKFKRTRNITNAIFDLLGHECVVETNVYSVPSPPNEAIPVDVKDSSVFEFVFRTVKPRIVLAHGAEAVSFLAPQGGTGWQECTSCDHSFWLYAAESHMRQWSNDKRDEIMRSLAERVQTLYRDGRGGCLR
jgi:hypothetical protein